MLICGIELHVVYLGWVWKELELSRAPQIV
jgi:hypothetical protein